MRQAFEQQNDQAPSGRQATIVTSVALTVALAGLGMMHERGLDKQDNQLRDRLDDEQTTLIIDASQSDNCALLHPNYARLCFQEQRGQGPLTADAEVLEAL